MEIIISNNKRILEIQQEFNRVFPYLKLEFFAIPPKFSPPHALRFVFGSAKTMGECSQSQHAEQLVITPFVTVSELAGKLRDHFGIGMQIFRQSGKVWLETTFTDGWTLSEQNSEGKALSRAAG